jgi:hypothetical protein
MIDVRGCGGYVLAAGSVLDERAYPRDPVAAGLVRGGRAYEVIDADDPVPLTGWLSRLLAPRSVPQSPAAVPSRGAADRLDGLVRIVREGRPGDRNGPLYWAACRAAEMVEVRETNLHTATEMLVRAALDAGLRGGEREARRTIASAMKGGSR